MLKDKHKEIIAACVENNKKIVIKFHQRRPFLHIFYVLNIF